jgi:hypothetical protein
MDGVLEALKHSYLLTSENGEIYKFGDFLFIDNSINKCDFKCQEKNKKLI